MSGGCEILKAQVSKTYSLMSTDHFGMSFDTDFLSLFSNKAYENFVMNRLKLCKAKMLKTV